MASFGNQYQNRSRSLSEIIHAHVNDQRMKCATIVHYVYFCQTFVLYLFICYHCFVPIFMAHWICPSVFALSSYSFDHRLLFVLYFVHCSLSCELFFWSHFNQRYDAFVVKTTVVMVTVVVMTEALIGSGHTKQFGEKRCPYKAMAVEESNYCLGQYQ